MCYVFLHSLVQRIRHLVTKQAQIYGLNIVQNGLGDPTVQTLLQDRFSESYLLKGRKETMN